MNIDLFGNEYDETKVPEKKKIFGYYQQWKIDSQYRLSENKEESCFTCEHSFYWRYSKKYYKCKKMGTSNSEASDIRLKNVCKFWIKDK